MKFISNGVGALTSSYEHIACNNIGEMFIWKNCFYSAEKVVSHRSVYGRKVINTFSGLISIMSEREKKAPNLFFALVYLYIQRFKRFFSVFHKKLVP